MCEIILEVSIFFFFYELYTIPAIRYAFEQICVNKMLDDGYCDMSSFIEGKITQEEMLYRLTSVKSKYVELYRYPYQPYNGNVWDKSYDIFSKQQNFENMTIDEASAIVYWTYMTCSDEEERAKFTLDFFKSNEILKAISDDVKYIQGVFDNSRVVELKIVSSISDFNRVIGSYKKSSEMLYYRGHANANYRLQPSIARRADWMNNEREMYNKLLIAPRILKNAQVILKSS